MRKIILILLAVFCFSLTALVIFDKNREQDVELISPIPEKRDSPMPSEKEDYNNYRTQAIKDLLGEFRSPLENKSPTFVSCADEHNVNPYLLVGISKVESTFGKNACEGNPFGWSSCKTPFQTFDSSCQAVAKGIATLSYYEQYRSTKRIRDLGQTYCPASTGCNTDSWINTVSEVVTELEERELILSLDELTTLTPASKSIKELEINTQVLKSHSAKATGTTLEVIEILIRANERALYKTQHES